MNSKKFETKNGTELPILNLKGKDYLEVKYRLVWFREEHPQWSIETEFPAMSDRNAVARATIRDESGRVIATSHKQEAASHFPDFMEKAETGAIGRALALIGYGTQFCADELDEGERIVDSPAQAVGRRFQQHPPTQSRSNTAQAEAPAGAELADDNVVSGVGLTAEPIDLGDYRINFGKKYFGKKLKEIPEDELRSYVKWLLESSESKGKAPSYQVRVLESAVDRYLNPDKFQGSLEEGSDDAALG